MKKHIFGSLVWLLTLCGIDICHADIILAENNRTMYQVCAQTVKMQPDEKAAVDDLAYYLQLISGADFITGNGKKYQIIVGRSAPSDKRPLKKHERRIVSENNNIYIWGEGRYGNVNAVYDFLKDVMNCRWFTITGDELIPRQKQIKLGRLDYSIVPSVPMIAVNQFSLTGPPSLVNFARRHGLHSGTDGFIGIPGHAIRRLLPCGEIPYGGKDGNLPGPWKTVRHKAYFKSNPEFFTMNEKGKRIRSRHYCFSNPELRKEFVRNLSDILIDAGYDGSPADFSIAHDDRSGKFCYCPNCLALEKKYDHHAGAYFDFVLYVADEIGKKYPNIMLHILAYRKEQTLRPPAPEKIRAFPPNITVRYAPLSADFSKPYTHPANREIAELFKAWSKVTPNIRWSAYPTTYPRPTFNFPLTANIRRSVENINFACANGIVSAYLEFGAGPADAFGFNDLRLYIYSEKLRRINTNAHELIREFTDVCYGQAAPALRKYLAELETEELATKKFMRWAPQVLYVDYASAEKLLRWTADFEQMEKSISAPRHLLNLRRARFTLDQTIIARWPYFTAAEKQRFGDLEKIIERCEKTIIAHNSDIASSFRQRAKRDNYIRLRNARYLGGLEQFSCVARGGKPLPEFMQKKKLLYRVLPNRNKQSLNKDPEAAFGMANFARYPENNRSIFTMHYYGRGSTGRHNVPKPVNRKRLEKQGSDNQYHWYHLGAVLLSADAVLMFDGVSDQSNFPLGHLYDAANPDRLYELYVSCAADKAQGTLRIDQLVIIPGKKAVLAK